MTEIETLREELAVDGPLAAVRGYIAASAIMCTEVQMDTALDRAKDFIAKSLEVRAELVRERTELAARMADIDKTLDSTLYRFRKAGTLRTTGPRARVGRPPLPRGQAKDAVLSLRLTPEELARVEHAANRAGQTASDWARDGILRAAESEAPYEAKGDHQ